MQFLIFEEEKFYASCTLKDKNLAPKQNERDCPLTQSICYYPFWGKSILILGKKLFLEIAQYQEVLLCVRKVTKEDVRKRI